MNIQRIHTKGVKSYLGINLVESHPDDKIRFEAFPQYFIILDCGKLLYLSKEDFQDILNARLVCNGKSYGSVYT